MKRIQDNVLLAKLVETEGRMVVTRGWEMRGIGEMLVKGYELPVTRWISSRDLMYSMVIIVNNAVLYTWKLLRE